MYIYVEAIAVLPSYQGQGIGAQLMKEVIDYAFKLNLSVVVQPDQKDNRALNFYRTLSRQLPEVELELDEWDKGDGRRVFEFIPSVAMTALRKARGLTAMKVDQTVEKAGTGDRAMSTTPQDAFVRKMLDVSGGGDNWQETQEQWTIGKLIYSPDGIQNAGLTQKEGHPVQADFFGNRPNWVYEVTNKVNDLTVYMGPDDVRRLFPQRSEQIAALRQQKDKDLSGYREKARQIVRLQALIGDLPQIDITQINKYSQTNEIGDRYFALLDQAYTDAQVACLQRMPGISLERLLDIMDDLTKVIPFMRSGKLTVVSREKAERLFGIISILNQSGRLNEADRNFLIDFHAELLRHQNKAIIEAAGWSARRASAVDQQYQANTPAYHANLWIANWLAGKLKQTKKLPYILDIGANNSVFWRVFRNVLGAADEPIGDGVIDLEKEDVIYKDAPNPNRVRADISVLDDNGLPKIEDATDEIAGSFVSKSHQLDIVVSSFVLDQLNSKQLKNALISISGLLKEPPLQEVNESNLMDFPLFIVASPENSPVPGSSFEKALMQIGFKPVLSQSNLSNVLIQQARESVAKEVGRDGLRLVESYTQKPFHVVVYVKTKQITPEMIKKISSKNLTLRMGNKRLRVNEIQEPSKLDRLDPNRLVILDLIGALKASDFQTGAEKIVNREEIIYDPKYKDFEERLACLIFLRYALTRNENDLLESILYSWDKRQTAFLTEEQVDFIMTRPMATSSQGIKIGKLETIYPGIAATFRSGHEAKQREASRRWPGRDYERMVREDSRAFNSRPLSFFEIYQREEEIRSGNQQSSLFDQLRPINATRIRKVREVVASIKGNGGEPTIGEVAIRMGMNDFTFRSWADNYNINFEKLGFVWHDDAARNKRIAQIKKAVAILKSQDRKPTTAEVAKLLDTDRDTLWYWSNYHGIDLTEFGVVSHGDAIIQKRIERIKKEVWEIKLRGEEASFDALAKAMDMDKKALWAWFENNEFDPKEFGVISRIEAERNERIAQIKKAAEELRLQGRKPSTAAVAKALNLSPQTFRSWVDGIKLNLSDLGVWTRVARGAGKDKKRQIDQIESAIATVKLQGKKVSIEEIARLMEIKPNSLRARYKRNGIDIDKLLDEAMTTNIDNTGGIDLTPANKVLQTQNSNGEIKFHMNPAMLAQLQNFPGFVPVIISIQPMTDIRTFLGLNNGQA